jgi:ornithine cyclodeaminase
MLLALLGEKISSISIFDLRSIPAEKIPQHPGVNIRVANSWQEAYQDADIFLTCTVSKERYIDLQPKTGSLQLNVSLRDYQPSLRHAMDYMIVDDWEEICRENTDIENMHKEENLQASDTISLPALAGSATLDVLPDSAIVMFNPMGMAVYDVAVATHYYRLSQATNVGTLLQ